MHALWGCQLLKEIWWGVETCRSFLLKKFANFRDFFHEILLLNGNNLAELVTYIAWSICFNRNAMRMGKPSLLITQIHHDAIEQLIEFQNVSRPPLLLPISAESHLPHWLPPLSLQFKSNYDRTIFDDTNCAGFGSGNPKLERLGHVGN